MTSEQRCHWCGNGEDEADLKWCDFCDKCFCAECEPYRDDDEPIDCCLECAIEAVPPFKVKGMRGELTPLPKGMSDGCYKFMAPGCHTTDSGEAMMTKPTPPDIKRLKEGNVK